MGGAGITHATISLEWNVIMPPQIDLRQPERTRASVPRQYGSESSVKAALLAGDHEWVWVATVLAGLSVFAQMDPSLDWAITIAYVASAIRLFRKDDFIVILAILAVFAARLYIYPGGVSLMNVFLLIYVARMLIEREAPSVGFLAGISFFLIGLQGILVVFPAKGFMTFLNYGTDCALAVSLVAKLRDPELLKKFMVALMIGALGACMYGLVNPYALTVSGDPLQIDGFSRFKGVLSDPNYMGLLLVLGIIGAQMLGRRLMVVRVVCSAILLAFIMQTGSLTALLALALGGLLFIATQRGVSKPIAYATGTIALLIGTANWRSIYASLAESGVFSFLSDRFALVVLQLQNGDYLSLGSGRVGIAQQYLDYFWGQDPFGQVFGGNLVGPFGLGDPVIRALGTTVPHNFQIELLMTIGLLGWSAVSAAAGTAFVKLLAAIRRTDSAALRMLAITKGVLFLYSFSLSVFPTWWFLALYLVAPSHVPGVGPNKEGMRK